MIWTGESEKGSSEKGAHMVELQEQHFIGKGKDRTCYLHPEDEGKCIKITHPPRMLANGKPRKKGPARRVAREVLYYKKLQRRGYDFAHVAGYYGMVETNLGRGHVYEVMKNADGSFAEELVDVLKTSAGQSVELDLALDQLFTDLYENLVPLAELHGGNICCAKNADGSWTLKLVDGIGNSDFIKYCDWSKFLMRKKLLRKFSKGISRLGKVEMESTKKWSMK